LIFADWQPLSSATGPTRVVAVGGSGGSGQWRPAALQQGTTRQPGLRPGGGGGGWVVHRATVRAAGVVGPGGAPGDGDARTGSPAAVRAAGWSFMRR
jgi:hypothetical protein